MSWFDRFRSLETRRRRALAKAAPGSPLEAFLSAPQVDPNTPLEQAPIVSLDLETTGLDPRKDEIVSIGLVEMQHQAIHLGTAWHQLVRLDKDLPQQSVVIHNITDDQLLAGRPIEELLPELLQRLRGKVMLAHYKAVELNFISAACEKLYGAPFVMPIIDTLELGLRVFELQNHTIHANNLRLFNLRPRYNLPQYRAHNALTDALATAELLLAISGDIAPRGNAPLKDFLSRRP